MDIRFRLMVHKVPHIHYLQYSAPSRGLLLCSGSEVPARHLPLLCHTMPAIYPYLLLSDRLPANRLSEMGNPGLSITVPSLHFRGHLTLPSMILLLHHILHVQFHCWLLTFHSRHLLLFLIHILLLYNGITPLLLPSLRLRFQLLSHHTYFYLSLSNICMIF